MHVNRGEDKKKKKKVVNVKPEICKPYVSSMDEQTTKTIRTSLQKPPFDS